MNKSRFLGIADGIRKERLRRSTQNNAFGATEAQHGVGSRFWELAKDLNQGERVQLLQSLKTSLEKERRRCLGRKQTYDPGRHISLYFAIKTLTSDNKKPPE
jgi:hypothetical protein